MVLYPKLEYQSQFGGEKLSHKDYCKMWAKSFIRNNCDILLCNNYYLIIFKIHFINYNFIFLRSNKCIHKQANFNNKFKSQRHFVKLHEFQVIYHNEFK